MNLKEDIYKIMDDKQCIDIVTINFVNKSPFLDHFLIGTVRNARMANAVIEAIEEYADNNAIHVKSISNNKESGWFLIDIGSIVIHIFTPEDRAKYDIEGLWKEMIEK